MIMSSTRSVPPKYVDSGLDTTVDTTGLVFAVSMPAQGTVAGTRTGDNIALDKLEIRLRSIVSDSTNTLRILLVQYHGIQTISGLTPANFLGPGTYDVDSFQLPYANNEDWTCLLDQSVSLIPNSSKGQWIHLETIVPKIRKIGFQINSVLPYHGQMYYVFLTDSDVIPHPGLSIRSRLWFRDD